MPRRDLTPYPTPRRTLAAAAALLLSGCINAGPGPGGGGGLPVFDLAVPTEGDSGRPPVGTPDLAQGGGGGGDGGADQSGPMITEVKPAAGAFIAGTITIEAKIEDPSGVDDKTVFAVFGGNMNFSVMLKRVEAASDKFLGQFDTTKLPKEFVLPILSIRAKDKHGNLTDLGAQLIVDNVPPGISLDPPPMFARQRTIDPNIFINSHAFDPVGEDAVDDTDTVGQLFTVRARIEDFGNVATGQTTVYHSLIDTGRVKLFVSRAALGELVVDTNGDGICDDVEPKLVPDPNTPDEKDKAIVVQMASIPINGAPNFTLLRAPSADLCNPNVDIGDGQILVRPPAICKVAPTIIFIKGYGSTLKEPAIWTIPPVIAPPAFNCHGAQFDTSNKLSEDGGLCVAIVAWDNAGNRNVSDPLRLCRDTRANPDPNTGPCAAFRQQPPSCRKACKAGVKLNTWKQGDEPFDPFPRRDVQKMRDCEAMIIN